MVRWCRRRFGTAGCVLCVWAVLAALGFTKEVRAEVDLWPLYESTAESTTLLYPLYVREKNFTMVFPLYANTNGGEDHHLLWPFLKVSKGRLSRVAPIWFSRDEDEFTLFPLIFRDRSSTLLLVPPMYVEHDGSATAVVPFYSSGHSVDPGTGERRDQFSILWPLYSKETIHSNDGQLLSRKRRWLLFSDELERDGDRTMRFLGIPVRERSA